MKRLVLLIATLVGLIGLSPGAAHAAPYALDTVSSGIVVPGSSISVYGNNFKPNSTVTVRLVGSGGSATIGTLQSNASGVATGRVTVPADTPEGNYVLQLSGPRPSGGTITLTFPITVSLVASLSQTPVGPSGTVLTDPAAAQGAGAGGTLPATGSDAGSPLAMGAGLIGLGAVAVLGARVSRRRSPLRTI